MDEGAAGQARTRTRQLFDGVAVTLLLLFTALGDATAMMAAAVLVLVIGFVAFPAERRIGTDDGDRCGARGGGGGAAPDLRAVAGTRPPPRLGWFR